jgi:hypothetical protein
LPFLSQGWGGTWLIIPREPYGSSPSGLSLRLVTNLVSFGAESLVGFLLLAAAWVCSFASSCFPSTFGALVRDCRLLVCTSRKRVKFFESWHLAKILLPIGCDTATGGVRTLPCSGHTRPPRFSNLALSQKTIIDWCSDAESWGSGFPGHIFPENCPSVPGGQAKLLTTRLSRQLVPERFPSIWRPTILVALPWTQTAHPSLAA